MPFQILGPQFQTLNTTRLLHESIYVVGLEAICREIKVKSWRIVKDDVWIRSLVF